MRYQMQERFFSLTDQYDILDEAGQAAFHISGKFFTIGNQLSLQDSAGNELAFIRQKLIAFVATYQIFRDDVLVATIKKDWMTMFRARFSIDVPGPNDLEAEGDFLDHEYRITRGADVVAEVSKRWLSLRDTYTVDVREGEDPVLVLAAAVVIDLVLHENRKN